jgi:hypothetical protein
LGFNPSPTHLYSSVEENHYRTFTFAQNFRQILSGQIGAEEESLAGHEPDALKLVGLLQPPNDAGTLRHDLGNHAYALYETGITLAQPGNKFKKI